MKRYSGFGSSGMSSYQYSAKKSVWKWTPAKIAAFSMFGIMMAALVYFESTSGRTNYEPVVIQEKPSSVTATTDFEKEYQEFLKRGKKIVSQETLDSLNTIQNDPEIQTSGQNSENRSTTVSENQIAASESKLPAANPLTNEPKIPASTNAGITTDNVEKKLETVRLTPHSNTQDDPEVKRNSIGTLEEVSPDEYQTSALDTYSVNNEDPDKVITEEFYTEETITGKVAALLDGTPIQGVQISVKGTSNRATTDSTGKYSITVPGDPQYRTIHYSYQGNTTERDVAPGTNVVNVRF